MAKCTRCGREAGLLKTMCDDCRQALAEEQAAAQKKLEEYQARRREEDSQREAEAFEAARSRRAEAVTTARIRLADTINEITERKVGELSQRLQAGAKVILYDSIYLPVDSEVNETRAAESFDIAPLTLAGSLGWDVVSVVPKTVGVGLTNVSADTLRSWGGGIGGNVIGVYVLLKKEILPQSNADQTIALQQYVSQTLRALMTIQETELVAALEKQLQQVTSRN